MRKAVVYCKECKAWVLEEDTEFVDIEEGPQGEDILTFACPTCKTEQRSVVRA